MAYFYKKQAQVQISEPTLTKIAISGQLELDLSHTPQYGPRITADFLADTAEVNVTLEKLARLQLSDAFLQTIFRKPALPLPLDQMTVSLQKRSFDKKRNRLIVPYTLSGYIIAPSASLLESVPELVEMHKPQTMTFIVPADPRDLFERLGYACANQDEVPLGLVEDTNYGYYFDPSCAPGVQECVDARGKSTEPCLRVLSRENGVGVFVLQLERVEYDETIAQGLTPKKFPTSRGGADLTVDPAGLADYDIIYKKFDPDSCAIVEGGVGKPGIRRLLRFTAITPNIGDQDLAFGNAEELASSTNQFVWSDCHKHYHFNGYAKFGLEKNGVPILPGAKLSFCLESTGRFANTASTDFTSPFQACKNQGITAGWVDEYFVGLDNQWLDITDLPIHGEGEYFDLTMEANPLKLLCEGVAESGKYVPALNDRGEPIIGQNGKPEMKQACKVNPEFYKNNKVSVRVYIPKSGTVVRASLDRGTELSTAGYPQ